MARRSKRARSLNTLFSQIPDDTEILSILFDLTSQADRTAAIVGATILEDRLRRSLARYLSTRITDDELDSLLFSERANGPLSTFDAKIRMAYCMGIINGSGRSDMDNIRRIRNGFAHSIPHHTFAIPEITETCNKLAILQEPMGAGILGMPSYLSFMREFTDAKSFYIMAIALHHW
jgi:hypothetical protein